MTCDMDHKATIGAKSIGDVAIEALIAGADLLLLSPNAVPHIGEIAATIVGAVESDRLEPSRLNSAVSAVYKVAEYRSASTVR